MNPKQSYIHHHLAHWKVGQGFWALNLDSLLVSIALGIFFLISFHRIASRATSGIPSRWQSAVEWIFECADDLTRGFLGRRDRLLGALALTLLVWLTLNNVMDFIPVDLFSRLLAPLGCNAFRAVPTSDLNMTLGTALGVLIFTLYIGILSHGFWGWLQQLSSVPFGHWIFAPINLQLEWFGLVSKTFSLAIRLFANMYAGETVFTLIAALCPWYVHWLAFGIWATMHLLIVVVQSLIFTTLSLGYITNAAETH